MMMLIVGCGSEIVEPEPTPTPVATPTPVPTPVFDINEYKAMAREYHETVCADMVALINMGETELKLMDLVKNITSNNVLTKQDIDSSYEINGNGIDFEADSKKISELYKAIIIIDVSSSKEAQEIEQSVRDSFSGYNNFYKTIYHEGLEYNSYKKDYAQYGTETINALDNLKLFCEE